VGVLVLLLLDPGQHFAETLVLDDGRVADTLQMVEDGVGHPNEHAATRARSSDAHKQPAVTTGTHSLVFGRQQHQEVARQSSLKTHLAFWPKGASNKTILKFSAIWRSRVLPRK
jgi:hypothetical protein